MADLNRTVGIIFTAQDSGSATAKAVADKLKDVGDSAFTATGKTALLDKELDKLGGHTPKISAVSAGLQALATSLVLKSFIDANVEAEKFTRAMTLLTGSSTLAGKEFEYVERTSNALGIQTNIVAKAYVDLFAATKDTTLSGQQTRDIFEAVGRAMAALGKSGPEAAGAFKAIEQIVSKGTVSLEELRQQLGDRLPGAMGIAARSMGITTERLNELVASGKLSATEFLPAFAKGLNETFGDAKFDGYVGQMAKLQNAIDKAFRVAGEAGTFPLLTAGIEQAGIAVSATSGSFIAMGGAYKAFKTYLSGGDIDRLKTDLVDVGKKAKELADILYPSEKRPPIFSDARFDAVQDAIEKITPAFSDVRFEVSRLNEESTKTDKALRTLGLNPKQFDKDVYDIREAFARLASDPAVSGDTTPSRAEEDP